MIEASKDLSLYEPDYSINLFSCVTSLNWYELHKDLLDEYVKNFYDYLIENLSIDRKWRTKVSHYMNNRFPYNFLLVYYDARFWTQSTGYIFSNCWRR